jgi:hypothetical protein
MWFDSSKDRGMWWIALWSALTGLGALGLVASVNSVRFGRQVAREAQTLTAPFDPGPLDLRRLGALPPPVSRMIAGWIVDGKPIDYVDFTVERVAFDRREAPR